MFSLGDCLWRGEMCNRLRKGVEQIGWGRRSFSRIGLRARVTRAHSNSDLVFLLSQVSHSW